MDSLELEKTWLVLQKISFKCQPFEVKLSKNIGIFSSRKIPRVIWVGLEKGINEIKELYSAIDQELANETFWRSEKNFIPHITMGRVKYLKYPDKLIKLLKNIEIPEISQSIHSMELMESHLTSQGPIYTVRSKFPFFK